MPRTVAITIPADETDDLFRTVSGLDGVPGVRVQRGVSVSPPGDLVTVEVTDRSLHPLMRVLNDRDIGRRPGSSVGTSIGSSYISFRSPGEVSTDTSEATWEEIEQTIAQESNTTPNGLLTMALGGFIAAMGIASGSLHIVIGAMVIAPGFEPLARIAPGLAAGGASTRMGLRQVGRGYLALLVGAAVGWLLLASAGIEIGAATSSYYHAAQGLVSYWTTVTLPSVLTSAAAAVAGAVLLASHRSVLTGGVMIALALVPTAAIVPMAVILRSWDTLWNATLRWGIDAVLVVAMSSLVFAWKRMRVHKRLAIP